MPKSFWNSEQRQIRQTNKANRQTWKMGLGRKRLQKRIGVMAAETTVYRRKVWQLVYPTTDTHAHNHGSS